MKRSTIVRTFAIAAAAALAISMSPAAMADDKGCSTASMKGTFAYTATGFIVAAPIAALVGPSAEVGTVTFDGHGNVSFNFNASMNGNIGPGTGTGSYTVSSDCTGTFTEAVPGFTSHWNFVIDDIAEGGNEYHAICQDAGVVVSSIGRRLYSGREI